MYDNKAFNIIIVQNFCGLMIGENIAFQYGHIMYYIIVESVSFVLMRDISPINPKKTIEIINSRDVSV